MSKRLSFLEFSEAIKNRRIPIEKLGEYLKFDPDSPIPKLTFRRDALVDTPPDDYDVDREVYQLMRQLDIEHITQLETLTFISQRKVVAEGDSWFNLPSILRPPAIADWIQSHRRFSMKNIAYWGHTLETILSEKEYLTAIDRFQPEYFMLGGGGNDLQQGLTTFIHSFNPDRPTDQYLTDEGKLALRNIDNNYRILLSEVISRFPELKILTFGYDYSAPFDGNGEYIGRYLRQLNIPDDKMNPIMMNILNRLNTVIKEVSRDFNNVKYLNCLGVTEGLTWYDDMHPNSDGFEALALKFEEEMDSI